MSNTWQEQLRDLENRVLRLESYISSHEIQVVHKAVEEAERKIFTNMSVDHSTQLEMVRFQKDLIFLHVVRTGLEKALGALLLSAVGGFGVGFLLGVWQFVLFVIERYKLW